MAKIKIHQQANQNYFEEGIKILELANKAYSLYKRQNAKEKARLLKIVQSNSTWDGLTLCPIYKKPFDILAKEFKNENWLPGQYPKACFCGMV